MLLLNLTELLDLKLLINSQTSGDHFRCAGFHFRHGRLFLSNNSSPDRGSLLFFHIT